MNLLVEQMLTAKHRNDLELAILEQTFEEDCNCASAHSYPDMPSCSIEVVARKTTCRRDFLICDSSLECNQKYMALGGVCDKCNNLAFECWTIRPI